MTLPERRHDPAGRILVEAIAVAQRTGNPVAEALGWATVQQRSAGMS